MVSFSRYFTVCIAYQSLLELKGISPNVPAQDIREALAALDIQTVKIHQITKTDKFTREVLTRSLWSRLLQVLMCAKYFKSLSSATASSGGRNSKTRDQFDNAITAKLLVIPQICTVNHQNVLNVTSNTLQKTEQNPQDPHRNVPIAGALIRQIFQAAHSVSNR